MHCNAFNRQKGLHTFLVTIISMQKRKGGVFKPTAVGSFVTNRTAGCIVPPNLEA
jgi:hypothetical protein